MSSATPAHAPPSFLGTVVATCVQKRDKSLRQVYQSGEVDGGGAVRGAPGHEGDLFRAKFLSMCQAGDDAPLPSTIAEEGVMLPALDNVRTCQTLLVIALPTPIYLGWAPSDNARWPVGEN